MPAVGNVRRRSRRRVHRHGGSNPTGIESAAFALAPILLLLHEDGVVFESLAGRKVRAVRDGRPPRRRRHGNRARRAVVRDGDRGDDARVGDERGGAEANAAATMATAPCAWRLATYLWRSERTSTVTILALAPINALVIVAADVGAARVLACTSVACAVGLFVAQSRARAAGMKAL